MPTKTLTKRIQAEIQRLEQVHGYDRATLEQFAYFVLGKTPPSQPELSLAQLKQAIYDYFKVKSTAELRKSGSFLMAIDGLGKLDFSKKATWEVLYRRLIDILPNETDQQGYGTINGIDIFKYFRPWQAFGLDPEKATPQDIKDAYHKLSKIYHPDNKQTGDARIFDRLNQMYKSIAAGV